MVDGGRFFCDASGDLARQGRFAALRSYYIRMRQHRELVPLSVTVYTITFITFMSKVAKKNCITDVHADGIYERSASVVEVVNPQRWKDASFNLLVHTHIIGLAGSNAVRRWGAYASWLYQHARAILGSLVRL